MTKIERDRNYWERIAQNYDRSMLLLGRPMPRLLEMAGEAVEGTARVLEVGAGTGLVTETLAAHAQHITATDYAAAMVVALQARIANRNIQNVTCEQADIYALRYPPQTFDAVVAANILHLLPDLSGGLAALRQMLKPGGRLIVPTFCHDQNVLAKIFSRVMALTRFPGYRRFSMHSLRAALESAGLQITRAELISGLIPIGYVEGHF